MNLPLCLARSSAFSIGVIILSTVRKAARLAVYDEIMIRVKNHQMPPTIRVEAALGFSPEPCLRNVPVINQNELDTENWFSMTSLSVSHGCGLFHSYGEKRAITKRVKLTSTYAARTYLKRKINKY